MVAAVVLATDTDDSERRRHRVAADLVAQARRPLEPSNPALPAPDIAGLTPAAADRNLTIGNHRA
jgi:hypothetical protein